MGKQDGLIKVKGQMGDLSFYKSKDGYISRRKGGIDGERIKNDPAFARIRENGQEFGRAGKAGKLMRSALRSLLIQTADHRVTGRLTRELVRVIKADANNPRGKRKVMPAQLALLSGFDFNKEAALTSVLLVQFTTQVERMVGTLTVTLPGFIPQHMLRAPQGATHFRIISAGCEIDFDNDTFITNLSNSPELEILPTSVDINPLVCTVTPNSTKPLLLALGIEFFQRVNGESYPMRNGAHNALSLVKVDGGA